jgi:uncharacterized protein with HEPN domain
MSKRGDKEFLWDITEAVQRIESYTADMTYEKFLQDTKTQDAVIRNIEIVGEAVKNISMDLRRKHKDIDWKNLAGMRDKIIHFYFGVNWAIAWSVIKEKLPALKEKIQDLLKKGAP